MTCFVLHLLKKKEGIDIDKDFVEEKKVQST